MRLIGGVIACFALVTVGCASSSSSSNTTPACTIEGTYAVHYTRDSNSPGNCPDSTSWHDEAITVTVANDTQATIAYQGAGGGCNADLNGCHLTDHCTGGLTNGGQLTRQDSWSFTDKGMGGETFFAFQNGPGGAICNYNALLSAARK